VRADDERLQFPWWVLVLVAGALVIGVLLWLLSA
jgi:hypothetical protein